MSTKKIVALALLAASGILTQVEGGRGDGDGSPPTVGNNDGQTSGDGEAGHQESPMMGANGGQNPCGDERQACLDSVICKDMVENPPSDSEEDGEQGEQARTSDIATCNANKLCKAVMECTNNLANEIAGNNGQTNDGDGSWTMASGGGNYRCEGEITCDLNTCMTKFTVANGTDTSNCKSDMPPTACPSHMAGVQSTPCDPWYEPPAHVMNATEIAAEQNTVCGAFSANPDVEAKCREDVQCMANPDAANCQQGPHVDNDHGDKNHERREQFEACIQDDTTGGMKNETGIDACKDDIIEMAKMEATMEATMMGGKGAMEMFDQTFDASEFNEIFDEIERTATVQADPCGAFEGDAAAKATCEKCSGIALEKAFGDADDALHAAMETANNDAECKAINDPEEALHLCLTNTTARINGAAAWATACKDNFEQNMKQNMKQKNGGEVDDAELEQDFELMQKEVQRGEKGDALTTALTGCKTKLNQTARENCFNTKMKQQAVALNTTLYELEELVHEEATMQFAEKMNDCANGKGNATTRTAADMDACVAEAVTVAANVLGFDKDDFDARDIEDFKEEGARRLAIEERDGCFDKIVFTSQNEKDIKEAACAAKEEDVFKNVQGIDKDMVFDQDRYEREQIDAAADKMADRFEQCDTDAHRKFKHNATQLDAAVNNCIKTGIKEYKKLTGETVSESDVLEFNEQAATKKMGDLANKCSSEADRDFKDCDDDADRTEQECKEHRRDMKNDCKGQMEDLLSAKLFGGISKEDMTDGQKIKLQDVKSKGAAAEALKQGQSCRGAIATVDATLKAQQEEECKEQEFGAFLAANNIDRDDMDEKELAAEVNEYLQGKEERAGEELIKIMDQCNDNAITIHDTCFHGATDNTTACDTAVVTALGACEQKGKAEYEMITGDTVDAEDFRVQREEASKTKANQDLTKCNTEALKLTGAAFAEKQQECEATAFANFNKANGVLDKDVASGDAKRSNEQKFKNAKEEGTNKGVAKAIMDAEKAGVSATEAKKNAKQVIQLSLGKENVTDYEVEQYIDQGADKTVMDTMKTCTDSLGDKVGEALSIALAECDEITLDAYKKSKMYDDVDSLDGEAKEQQERSIEVEYRVSRNKAVAKTARTAAKVYKDTQKAAGVDTSTSAFTIAARANKKEVYEAQGLGDENGIIDDDTYDMMLADDAIQEAADASRACFETAMELDDVSKQDVALAGCTSTTRTAFEDTYMRVPGEAAIDSASLSILIDEAAASNVANIGAAFSKANKGKDKNKKASKDDFFIAMGQEIQRTTADKTVFSSNTKIQMFVNKGAVSSTINVIKAKKPDATSKETRETLIAVLEESTYDTITPTDAEMFLHDAASTGVKDLFKSCSGNTTECNTQAEAFLKDSVTGGKTMDANQIKTKLARFKDNIARTELSNLNEACVDEDMSKAACTSTKKNSMATILGKPAADIEDHEMELYEMKGSQDKVEETMSACREDTTKSVDACRLEAVSAYKKSEGIDAGTTVDPAEFQDTFDKGFNSGVKDRISACILAADGVAEVEKACREPDAFKEDLKGTVVDADATITNEEIRDIENKVIKTAVGEAAAGTRTLPDADKRAEFRISMNEIGEDFVGEAADNKYMNENDFVAKAADSAVALQAKACSAANTVQCDVTKVYQDVTMAPTNGGRRRLTATKTQKIKSKGATAMMQERGEACLKLHKDDATPAAMTACVSDSSDVKAAYKQLMPEKNIKRDEKKARSRIGAEKVRTCFKAGVTDGADAAAKATLRTTCKAAGKEVMDKFVLKEADGTIATKLETTSEAVGREAFEMIVNAADCEDSNRIACEDEVKEDLSDVSDKKPETFGVRRIAAHEAQASTNWALCEEAGGSEADCKTEAKTTLAEHVSTEYFEARETQIKQLKDKKKAGKGTKVVTRTDEVETLVSIDGACDDTKNEMIREDIGKAAKGSKDKVGADTIVVSAAKVGNKCQVLFKTKVDEGKAEEMASLIVAKGEALGKAKGTRRLNQRRLDGASSVSASATTEEVGEDDSGSAGFSGGEIKADDSDSEAGEGGKSVTPKAPAPAGVTDDDSDGEGMLSAATTHTVAVTAVVCFVAALFM